MTMKNKIFKTINITFCVLILASQMIIAQGIIPSPPIIQPGAPGEPSKKLDAEAATDIANTSYIKADVKFLQGMIVHHEQAIIMSEMANQSTNNAYINRYLVQHVHCIDTSRLCIKFVPGVRELWLVYGI